MKAFSRNIIFAVAALLALALIFPYFTGSDRKAENIGFSDLVKKIENGEVSKIQVRGDTLFVTLADGKTVRSEKEPESSLSESLANYGASKEKIAAVNIENAGGSSPGFWVSLVVQILLPFILIGLLFWYLSRQAQKGAVQAFTFGKANARIFANPKERMTFNDVAGLKEAKEELREIVDFLRSPQKFLDIGARIPRGVLLMGAPGTGKTMLARAVAGEANVPFFHISGSEFVEMFVGVGASRVRDLFATAKRNAPSIVFIDEIDAVGRQRGAGLGGGHDEREQTLNQILVEMDGFDRDTNVIVMAATNRPDILDPALLRPGRFDRRVVLDLPDIKEREDILKIHARGKKLAEDVDLQMVAQRTPGFAGADLANLVNEAAILAARRNRKIIMQEDLLNAMEKVILGPERKSHILTPKEREITAFHEAGHAVVAAALPNADPVHKISIVSRGRAAGYTLKLPVEDRHLYTKGQFLDELAAMLGGYATEKVVFNEITTGASSDLREASDLARRLVTQYGMSEKLGPMTFGKSEELVFLGREIATERNYSEKVAAEIDGEIRGIIKKAYETARKVVVAKKKLLANVAKRLMEVETIEKDEFEEILKKFGIAIPQKQPVVVPHDYHA